ncbi:MAG: type II toxin-antitoxin system RelE/ParE family toxin [Pseudomonadota bacterium]
MSIEHYVDADGVSPFSEWFDDLDAGAAARVVTAVERIGRGAVSNVKGVGGGVLEYRIDAGPGYRIYFGRDGPSLVLLLAGGSKRRQQRDIEAAKRRWVDYNARRRL